MHETNGGHRHDLVLAVRCNGNSFDLSLLALMGKAFRIRIENKDSELRAESR